MTGWHLGPMVGFDLETTGVDVEQDRVLTAAVATLTPGERPDMWHQLCDPGVDIPEGATAIHGITTDRARAEGAAPELLLHATVERLYRAVAAGRPIVGMNLAFDLTMLDRDCRRHGVEPLFGYLSEIAPVIDVLVVDKYVDQYRPGSRKLVALAEHYGVRHDGAHDAAEDTLCACRVAWKLGTRAHLPPRALFAGYHRLGLKAWQITKIGARFREVRDMPLMDLHWAQARWRAEQAESLEEYLRRTDDEVRVDPWWPVRPFEPAVVS